MGSPFTDEEKRFVLTEMIKASQIDMEPLVQFVKANCLSYSWFSLQLPAGRTVDQCIEATEQMLEAPIPPQSLKREPPSRLLSVASSAPSSQPKFAELVNAPSFPPTLSGQTTSQSATPHVPIQPRVVNGTSHPPPASPASPAEPPTKKRRGRPPRRQNLRDVSKPPPRPLHPLAPHPAVGASPAVPTQEGKGTPGQIAGETRGQKRGRGSSDETEIKAEGSVATPPTRSSPVVCSESDGAEDGKES